MSMSTQKNTLKIYDERPAASSHRKRRSELSWMGCAVNIQSLNSVARKGLTIISITAGARTFWKPVKDDWLGTLFAKPAQMKSLI